MKDEDRLPPLQASPEYYGMIFYCEACQRKLPADKLAAHAARVCHECAALPPDVLNAKLFSARCKGPAVPVMGIDPAAQAEATKGGWTACSIWRWWKLESVAPKIEIQ